MDILYGGFLRFARGVSGIMSGRATNPVRKARADAVRNRERLLKAAADIFSVGGPDASLEAVAKRAGVGIGTLYRHFPTREALFEAVYRREVDQLSELAERLTNELSPSKRCDAGCTPMCGSLQRRRAWWRPWPSRRIALPSFTPILRIASRRPSVRCSTAPPRPARYAPISRLKTFCARSWACPTTSTTPQIGEGRRYALPTYS